MLTSLHIQGFKSFKDTVITPLRKVNLILGGQNVGKTSLLEAVYFGAKSLGEIGNLPSVFRKAEGQDAERFFKALAKDKKIRLELSEASGNGLITGINSLDLAEAADKRYSLSTGTAAGYVVHRYPNSDPFAPRAFSNPLAVSVHLPDQARTVQLFDTVVIARKKRRLLEMLKSIEPRLEDMHSLSPDGDSRIYVELEGHTEALPLPLLGHGFSRLVFLYCSLLVTEAKLALIDEVENGIHYSSLPTLFQGIQDIASSHGVQTLMTTHSWECIQAAFNTFAQAGNLSDFQLVRLEREGDNVKAVVINDEQLVAVMEAGYEVR